MERSGGLTWAAPADGANGKAPRVIWQSDTLTSVLASVLVVPLTTNLDRAQLAGTALLQATEGGLPDDSVALAFVEVET